MQVWFAIDHKKTQSYLHAFARLLRACIWSPGN